MKTIVVGRGRMDCQDVLCFFQYVNILIWFWFWFIEFSYFSDILIKHYVSICKQLRWYVFHCESCRLLYVLVIITQGIFCNTLSTCWLWHVVIWLILLKINTKMVCVLLTDNKSMHLFAAKLYLFKFITMLTVVVSWNTAYTW